MSLFTYKYAPKNEHQIFGQDLAVSQLKHFILHYNQQKYRAALLLGPIGVGKTAAVYALAQQLNYDLLEMNSSEVRNEEAIKSFLNAALGQQSLFFRSKIILIDEVDNISGVQDRGCLPALLQAIEKSKFPVILTANDVEESKFKALKKASLLIEFPSLSHQVVKHGLEWVAQQEGLTYEDKAMSSLARQADGDLRAALLDLHACGKNITFNAVINLSARKRTESVLNALTIIFKSSSAANALPALDDVDIEPRDMIIWIDENVPREYLDPKSLAKAYEMLARADVFQGRISKRQHWRFLVYITNLLTAGISSAKEQRNTTNTTYTPTMRFLKMWQAKMKAGKRDDVAVKLAQKTHTSKKVAREQLLYLKPTLAAVSEELQLTEEELEWVRKS